MNMIMYIIYDYFDFCSIIIHAYAERVSKTFITGLMIIRLMKVQN